MTVSLKLKNTQATLEGILSDFKTMREETSDSKVKSMFNNMIVETEDVLNKLKSRIEFVNHEEPQYREEE